MKLQDLKDCAIGIVSQRLVRLKDHSGYRCVYDILQDEQLSRALEGSYSSEGRLDQMINTGVEKGIYDPQERTY